MIVVVVVVVVAADEACRRDVAEWRVLLAGTVSS
jgi:hypothetical protein